MFKKDKKIIVLFTIMVITVILIIPITHFYRYLGKPSDLKTNLVNNNALLIAQSPTNDTTAPIITFIQPSENHTIIRKNSYLLIANISDDHPPSYGNVSIQISNQTYFLFNATMNYNGENQWSFNWDNISSYPNNNIYKIKVWAMDSSQNENYGWSEEFYISLSISTTLTFLTFLIYILVVSLIFAGIIVYANRKIYRKSSMKKKRKNKMSY